MKLSASISSILCAGLIALIGLAPGSAHAQTVSVDKTFYQVRDPITLSVNFGQMTASQIQGAQVGTFYLTDAANKYGVTSHYVNDQRDGTTGPLAAPSSFGTYEVRIYDSYRSTIYARSAPFTVGSRKAGPGELKINATSVLVGDTLTVTIDGLTSAQIGDGAQVGIWRKTDITNSTTNPLKYDWISSLRDNRTWTTTAPKDFGDYEVRVFTKNLFQLTPADVQTALFGTIPFTVTSHTALPGDITLSKTVFAPGEAAVATLTGFGAGEIKDLAAAGIYKPSDLLEAYAESGGYTFISSLRDGKTWEFTAPTAPGSYELRVFTKYTAETRAESLFGIIAFEVREVSSSAYHFTVVPGKQLSVKKGKSGKIKVYATRRPDGEKIDAVKMVTFGTMDRSVAVVDAAGVVKGVGRGTTYIKISYGKVLTKIKVTVS